MSKVDDLYALAGNSVKRNKIKQAKRYFRDILKIEPDHINSRKALRALYLKSAGPSDKYLAIFKGAPLLLKMAMAKSKKKFDEGLAAAEAYLELDPNNNNAILSAARFAAKLELREAAKYYYEIIAERFPKDKQKIIEAADYLSDLKEPESFKRANELMENLVNANSKDLDLRSEQNRISVKMTLDTYENAENSSDIINDIEDTKKQQEENEGIRSSADLEKALKKAYIREEEEPDNVRHKEAIAKLLMQKGDTKEAIDYFDKAIKIDSSNQTLQELRADAAIKLLEKRAAVMKKRARSAEGADKEALKKKLRATLKKLKETKMTEFQRRIKVNPNDLRARYDLGVMYFEAKKIDPAIQQFQRAVIDPKIAFKAATMLGNCFREKKMFDLAITQFKDASTRSGLNSADKLNLQYEIGKCQIETGQKQEALDTFKRILEKDYGFRDVAKIVESLQN